MSHKEKRSCSNACVFMCIHSRYLFFCFLFFCPLISISCHYFIYLLPIDLNLSNRPLSEVAVFHIADALDHSRKLSEMHFDSAYINDKTCGTICNAIIRDQEPHLKTLTMK